MQENLVIVESPAKAKKIEEFLGKDYKVMSSYGHIRDLKKKELSINEKTMEPDYEIPEEKKKLVTELKTNAKKAKKIWLASDEDREGEAISWHLCEVLGLDEEKTNRIVFHEITKQAILDAIKNPRHLDMNLVNAQQARRVLDRLVGFKLSPILWRKVKPALSAGRVQSVAVRLIVEREREIQKFQSVPYYRVTAIFALISDSGNATEVKAELDQRFNTHEEVEAFLEKCKDAKFMVESVTKKPLKRSPAPPFTTSTLQQEAARKLGFTVVQTMMIAQKLYESGRITYMRTDIAVQWGGKAAAGHALTVAGSGHAGAHAVQLLPGAQPAALQIAGIHRQAGCRKVFHREVHQYAAQLRCRGIAQQLHSGLAVQQGRLARKTRLLRRSGNTGEQGSGKADRTGTGTFQE